MSESNQVKESVIVGWGLAGAVMAWQLYFAKKSFQVKDSLENHSTRVAAGLVNPVVFKRLTKSWNADVLMPAADSFYSKIECVLGVKLLSHQPILRVFASTEEENNWSASEGDDRFKAYLFTPTADQCPPQQHVNYPFGMGGVKTIGNLDTVLFLEASKSFFITQKIRFDAGFFDTNQMDPQLNYIFCEGVGLMQNTLFNYLPMKPTHGETLVIETDALDFDATINKNMFVMRLSDRTYKIGATYNWELNEPIVTDAAKTELIERLESFTSFTYKINDHQAGIRPTVSDRKPLLGIHPIQKNAFIFNGLGTKGVMIAPFYAQHLLDFIFQSEELEKEVNITRFQHYHTS